MELLGRIVAPRLPDDNAVQHQFVAAIDSAGDVEDVREELIDRFGEIPLPARNLLRVALIRSVASRLDLVELNGSGGRLRIIPDPRARGLKVENIPLLLKMYKNRLSFTAKGGPQFLLTYPVTGITVRDEENLLQAAEDLLVNMAKVLR